ncbi:MAG: FtsB family cell division protein [Acidimicrobiales bacterium]
MRRQGWAVAVSVVVIGVLFVAVFPTRTWLAQRRDLEATERKVAVLAAQNASLEARVTRLNTDAEIERLAREQYNLVRPGEEAYAVLPAPPVSRTEPAPARAEDEPGFWGRLWEDLSFW